MAATITLDEVVRKTLHKSGLPLHYYIKYLVFARDGLKEMQLSILPSEQTVELTLDANSEVTLPADFVGEVALYRAEGDKLIELPHNYLISSFDGAPFDVIDPVFSSGESIPLYTDEFRSDVGRQFGHIFPRLNGYRVIPELNKIRIDNGTELDKVYLKYVTMPVKVGNKSLIHPFIEPAIVAYINWQVAFYAESRDVMMKKAEYYQQRKISKSAFRPLTITDILSSFRMYHNQTIKA